VGIEARVCADSRRGGGGPGRHGEGETDTQRREDARAYAGSLSSVILGTLPVATARRTTGAEEGCPPIVDGKRAPLKR
jgi:hypothetical protein